MKIVRLAKRHKGRHSRPSLLKRFGGLPSAWIGAAVMILVASVAAASLGDGSDIGDPDTVGPTSTTSTAEVGDPTRGDGTTDVAAAEEQGGTTYYVAPSGSDSSTGSRDTPWRTIGHSITQLAAGDTLVVRQGVYVESIRTTRLAPGTPTQRITVTAAAGEVPVLQGLLWLVEPDHWTIEGLTIEWSDEDGGPQDHMVKLTGGTGWVFRNNEVRGAKSYAAVLVAEGSPPDGPPTFWRIADNCIHDTEPTNGGNQDHLIYVNSGTEPTYGVIEHNVLWGAPNGAGIKLGGPSADIGGASNVTVRFNTIAETFQSVSVSWQSDHNIIIGNVMARIPDGRSHIRAFELIGVDNHAYSNVADKEPLVWADDGHESVINHPDNRITDVDFSNEGRCDGWLPTAEFGGAGHVGTGPTPTTSG